MKEYTLLPLAEEISQFSCDTVTAANPHYPTNNDLLTFLLYCLTVNTEAIKVLLHPKMTILPSIA